MADAQKPTAPETPAAIQEQINKLTQILELQKAEAVQKTSNSAEAELLAQQERLREEADIKALLSKAPKEDVNLDDLSPKEILDIVANAFDTAIDAKAKIAQSEMVKPLSDLSTKLDNLQKYLIQKEAQDGVSKVRTQFKDFDEHKEDITKVLDKYPGIDIKDAYLLAKAGKAAGQPAQADIETERPVSLATRAAQADSRFQKDVADGKKDVHENKQRKSFRESLAEAAERVMGNRHTSAE